MKGSRFLLQDRPKGDRKISDREPAKLESVGTVIRRGTTASTGMITI
jgi:hypothetical protein